MRTKRSLAFLVVFVVSLVSGLALSGCGYIWKPINQCNVSQDCASAEKCVRNTCTVTSGTDVCVSDIDCKADQRCTQRVCIPNQPKEALPFDGGNGKDGGTELPTPGREVPQPDTPTPPEQPIPEAPTPETTPIDGLPKPPPSTYTPVTTCLAGTSRRCRFARQEDNGSKCGVGVQACLFDGTWESCKYAPPFEHFTKWGEPSEKESCNEKDDDCDGQIDEGCYDTQSYSCSAFYRLYYGVPQNNKVDAHPDAPAKAQDVFVRYDADNKRLVLSRALDTKSPAGPQIQSLLYLPQVGDNIGAYHLSPDRRMVAAATATRLIVWLLTYDPDGHPSISGFLTVAIDKINQLWFRGVDQQLIVTQSTYIDKKSNFYLSRWQIDEKQQTLTMGKRIVVPDYGNESFFRTEQPIDPTKKWIAFHSYNALFVFSLPDLALKGRLPLEYPPDPETRHLLFHPTKPWLLIAPYRYAEMLTLDMTPDAQGNLPLPKVEAYKLSQDGSAYGVDFQSLRFDPLTGDLLASSYLGTARWKTPAPGQSEGPEFTNAPGSAFAMNQKATFAFIGNSQGTISVLDVSGHKIVHRWQMGTPDWQSNNHIYTLRMSPNQTTLLVRKLDVIELWDVRQDAQGAWSAKKLQDLLTIKEHKQKYSPNPLLFNHDGSYLVTATGAELQAWKRDDSTGMYAPAGRYADFKNNVEHIAIHPTKPWVVATNADKELRFWAIDNAFPAQLSKTYTEAIAGVGFYLDKSEMFVLTVMEAGIVVGSSWKVEANGAVVTKDLTGKANLYTTKVSDVQFDATKARIFFRAYSPTGNNQTTIHHHDFYISPAKADGSREISQSSVRRTVPDVLDAIWMRYHPATKRFFAFSAEALYLWGCPF